MSHRNSMLLSAAITVLMVVSTARSADNGFANVTFWAIASALWGACFGVDFIRWRLSRIEGGR